MRKLLVFVFAFVSLYANSQVICGGQSTTLQATNPSGLTGPSYSLNPGGFSSIGGTFVVSPPSTTTYTLYTTGQNTNNATVTTSLVTQVTVNPQPSSTPTLVQSSCTSSLNSVNLGVTFNPGNPAPSYTIGWTPLPASVLAPTQTTASALTPGPYTVAITAAGGCSLAVFFTVTPQPAPAVFSVVPFGSNFSITCVQDTVVLTATNANNSYTWTGAAFSPIIAPSISLTASQLGTLGVVGSNTVSGCTATYTFHLWQNVAVPSSSMSTNLISITCSQTLAPTLSLTASPSVNVTHFIYAPNGGTFSAQSYTTIYYPGSPGTYTYVLVNDVNGCSTTKNFTVTSSDSYPTYSVTSPISNFTLGCTTKSVATIQIVNAATTPTPGGPVSYTIIGPPTSTVIPTGTLSGLSTYTINVPGTWTVLVKDNTNNCITSTPISILQNTLGPDISAVVPQQILDCNTTSIVLQGVSQTPNVSYNWGFQGAPGNVANYSITVTTTAAVTQTLINTYTLTITDNGNTCTSHTTVPMYQNTFPPTTSISASANSALTCVTPTVVLTNQSRTGIPSGLGYPTNQPVIGYLWEGPTPQQPLQVNSTYVAGTTGVYTLTGKDLNNGCISTGTFNVGDNRNYPTINAPPNTNTINIIDCGDPSTLLTATITGSTTGLTYSWTAPTATSVVGTSTGVSLAVKYPGTYTITVTNTVNGCVSKATMAAVNGSLTAEFKALPDTGFAPLTVVFTNNSSSTNGNSNIISAWNFGNGTTTGSTSPTGSFTPGPISSSISPTTVYNQPGTYTVTMYATKGSCLDTVVHYIKVEIPSSLTVPNIFTPNGDGVNDLFFLKTANLDQIDITIFDRWGQTVYQLTSTTGNVEWDGKNAQGKDVAAGTYFYVLKATGGDGSSYNKKGTITIAR